MDILYNIHLEDCFKMKQRDYLSFTSAELSNNLLNGKVAFVDEKKNNSIVFEAELLKFFIDMYNELIEAKKNTDKDTAIYSMYQSYAFEIIVEKNTVHLTYNKVKKLSYNYKVFLEQINKNRDKLYKDYKMLYPNYEKIENGNFLVNHFE